ncbi:MAG: glutaminyl-peptide cyclotransferase [Planctomycetaceae bacterium]|nr:glutaminyl-peptide cyclotransferase [Planctomycetaceae bacterium]
MMTRFLMMMAAGGLLWGACVRNTGIRAELPEQITLRPAASYPHDTGAYTQGLVWDDGILYESTGQYGQSTLRHVNPRSGTVSAHVTVPPQFFAEGLALAGDSLYLLTWREKTCFVFDKKTLQKTGQFPYNGEGWGLTFDGQNLIMSDGTSTLRFLDPKTFKLKRKIEVSDKNRKTKKTYPVRNLNELEWIHGEIWANVWQTTQIVRIEPNKGTVIGWIDMTAFVPEKIRRDPAAGRDSVLNGIAFDPKTGHVYITGKNWDVMYCFKLIVPEQ